VLAGGTFVAGLAVSLAIVFALGGVRLGPMARTAERAAAPPRLVSR
jgi:hypothetical protein